MRAALTLCRIKLDARLSTLYDTAVMWCREEFLAHSNQLLDKYRCSACLAQGQAPAGQERVCMHTLNRLAVCLASNGTKTSLRLQNRHPWTAWVLAGG